MHMACESTTLQLEEFHVSRGELAACAGGDSVFPWEDTWEEPTPRFEAWVQDCVLHTLARCCRPGSGALPQLRREEAVWAFRKAVRVVIDNERKVGCVPSSSFSPRLQCLCGPCD